MSRMAYILTFLYQHKPLSYVALMLATPRRCTIWLSKIDQHKISENYNILYHPFNGLRWGYFCGRGLFASRG